MQEIINEMNSNIVLPLLPLRGLVALPGTHLHFDVGRKKSILAVDEAMKLEQNIFLVAQKDIRLDEPNINDLYNVGTIGKIKQVLKLPGENIKVLIEGIARANCDFIVSEEPYFEASVRILDTVMVNSADVKSETLIRIAQETFDEYSSYFPKMPSEILMNILTAADAGFLADYITSNTPLKFQDKQAVLETINPLKRLENVIYILNREIEILSLDREINIKVKEQIDKNQREYYLREQIKAIQGELGENEGVSEEANNYKKKIENLKLEPEISSKLLKDADRLLKLPFGSHEGGVLRNYLDVCIELPFNKTTKDRLDIKSAEKILNADHYGLTKVKERILEFLSVKIMSKDIKGQIICLVGPPGVGKTSIAVSVARALSRKYARVSLGGVRDEADIRGHRKTYIGAMPGRIINAVKQAGSKNAVILLDEIDKLGNDFRGDPSAALLEVLDPEQNKAFRDHFIEIPFDLSDILFITTANTFDTIPRPLLDRMEVIEIPSYTAKEKLEIAKRHLFPKQLKKHGLSKANVKMEDEALDEIISGYTKEAGVRSLERELATVCRRSAKKIVSGETKKVIINKSYVEKLLGPIKFKRDTNLLKSQIGIATGLAWTSVGGEILSIEVNAMDGTGKLELTGSLGDVMKESARAAISYIRSRTAILGIDKDFYKNKDIHIHVPDGAVPKDGPSAGITIATAIASELSGNPVRGDVAMTGEVTLRGRVIPIGGLREKTMAAFKAGVKTVIIPADNASDLDEIDEAVKSAIKFIPVSDMDKVIENAIIFSDSGTKAKQEISNSNIPIVIQDSNSAFIKQ